MGNITHKELLTFSNLTNLEWHFVDLAKGGVEEGENVLNKFLKPESFIDKNRKGKFEKYVYMENVKKEKILVKKI